MEEVNIPVSFLYVEHKIVNQIQNHTIINNKNHFELGVIGTRSIKVLIIIIIWSYLHKLQNISQQCLR